MASDIDAGTSVVEWAINESERLDKHIVYVLGNHEFYGYEYKNIRVEIQSICAGTSVNYLDCGVQVIGNVRIIGTTLCTDYKGLEHFPLDRVMCTIEYSLADHHKIHFESNSITIKFKPHHAPHPVCQHPAFPINELSTAFHSDLSQLIEKHDIDLWVYGHTHANIDQIISDTRNISNQGD